MLAASIESVRVAVDQWAVAEAARCTVRLESPSPAKDRAVNGTTWRARERLDRHRQTQRRFSSKDGTVPMAVATRLANNAPRPSTATPKARVMRLVAVAMADTPA
jgi:hypothetical protein